MKKKVAIYFDNLLIKGGAERVALELAERLDADLITSGVSPDLEEWINPKVKIVNLGNTLSNISKNLGVLLETPLRFYFFSKKSTYDVNIFIGYNSIYGANKDKKNIWFCLSPNRMLYDLREYKQSNGSFLKRIFFQIYCAIFQKWDQHIVKNNFLKIVSQTRSVKERVVKYYREESTVIYSPIDTSKYQFKSFGDFFLTVGRLVPEKRIDLICKAFLRLPDKKLIVVGDGPDKEKLLQILSNSQGRIKLVNNLNEQELLNLYANCIATLYYPINEDFGLVPLEGMASGKCCIAVNEGGCLETIVNKVTGELTAPTEVEIMNAVSKLSLERIKENKEKCIEQARKFDIQECISKWKVVINSV